MGEEITFGFQKMGQRKNQKMEIEHKNFNSVKRETNGNNEPDILNLVRPNPRENRAEEDRNYRSSRWERGNERRSINEEVARYVRGNKRAYSNKRGRGGKRCFGGMNCDYGMDCTFDHTDEEWEVFRNEGRRMWGRRRAVSAYKPRERPWKKECHFGLKFMHGSECRFYHTKSEIE